MFDIIGVATLQKPVESM